jgi:hypothetical protein
MRRVLIAVAASAALLPALPAATVTAAPSSGPACAEVLDDPERGEQAIDELGADIAVAAARNDVSTDDLRDTLQEDDTIWLDPCGRMFAVDPVAGDHDHGDDDAGDAGAPQAGAFPTSETFNLHSRPGSDRVIYLDFTGQANITGTAWNTYAGMSSFTALPFSIDGDTTTFSAAEHTYIQQVWQWVAEDFAPFDVDVTTEDPGTAAITRTSSADITYGTRVMLTHDNGWLQDCGCGGIAYIGVFDHYSSGTYNHAYYQPAWVYAIWSAKTAAEGATHEAGHNLGLQHQGYVDGNGVLQGYYTGHGAWAPIMGVGYYRPVTQWSASEYQSASTPQGGTQNDLTRIGQYGLSAVADDHAGALSPAATPIADGTDQRSGVIASSGDTDVFRFTTDGGPTQIAATPAAAGPNLDIDLALFDADGDTVAASNPPSSMVSATVASGLNAGIEDELPAGTYYARVQGSAHGNPLTTGYSTYGSLGAYTVSVSMPLQLTTTTLPAGEVGTAYAAELAAAGGAGAHTWSATGLPAGLSLSASGTLRGTPATAGQATITARVTDATGTEKTRALSLTVDPKTITPPPTTPSTPPTTPATPVGAPLTAAPAPTTQRTAPDQRRSVAARSLVRYRGRAATMTLSVWEGRATVMVPRISLPRGTSATFRLCVSTSEASRCRDTRLRATRRTLSSPLRAADLDVADDGPVTATLSVRGGTGRSATIGRIRVPGA